MLLHTRANELWHVDGTYRSPGARFSFLHARTVTQAGGQPEFCDGRRPGTACRFAQGRASRPERRSFHRSFMRVIGFDMGSRGRSRFPAVIRRLVRRHEPSGRDALLLASHIDSIEGVAYTEGRTLIDELIALATAPEHVYRHKWRMGDLLMWDNRCIIHRATPYAYHEEVRDMRSCRTIDTDDSGLAAPQVA